MTEKHSDIPRSSSSSPSEGSSRCSTPDPLDIAAYNDLMTARLPIIPPVKTIEELVQAQPSRSSLAANGTCTRIAQPEDEDGDAGMIDGRPMTKAEKQNAKKKRRKEREKAMKEQEAKEREEEVERERQRVKRAEAEKVAIPFRLFSCHPIQPIKLIPKQDYPTTANPLSVSYTPTQAERRRQQAIEAAFDTSSLSCPVPVSVSGSAAGPSRRPLPTYTPRQPLPPAPPLPAHGAPTTSTRTKVAGGATLELTPMGALSGGGGGGAVVGPAMMVLLTEKDRPRRITRCMLNSTDEGAVVSKHLQVHGQGLIEPHAELSKRKQQAMEVFPRIVLPRTKGLARRIPWVEMTLRDHHSSIPQIGEDISLELSPTTSLQGPAITLPVHVKAPDQPSETPKEAPEKQEALPRAPSRPLGKSRRRARTLARRLVLSSTTPTAFVQTKNSAHTDIAGGRTKEFKRVPPRFWAPEVGIGGKARGYAWGYRDSREIRGGGVEGEGDGEGKGWVRGAYVRSKDR